MPAQSRRCRCRGWRLGFSDPEIGEEASRDGRARRACRGIRDPRFDAPLGACRFRRWERLSDRVTPVYAPRDDRNIYHFGDISL